MSKSQFTSSSRRNKIKTKEGLEKSFHYELGRYGVEKDTLKVTGNEELTKITWFAALSTYLAYAFLICMGHFRDLFSRIAGSFGLSRHFPKNRKNYAPLLRPLENFYTRRLYHRISDCWNRPICSSPGAHIEVMERERSRDHLGSMRLTGRTQKCINLGSYNYLGFGDDWNTTCREPVLEALKNFPAGISSARMDLGTTSIHHELEKTVARFVGKEDAVVFNMGFGTNAATIPALIGKGGLIISDSLNHTSIVNGCRASGAMIRTFAHNDPEVLDETLREAIALGQPRTRRPWKKILVMVEGIYSMEGEICDLKAIVSVCKKYKVYLYLDEAHSIGALGPTGRGACEYCGVDPEDVDILMGTFTKSFSGMGGYIAGSKEIVDYLRVACSGLIYHNALSPVVSQQILHAIKIIMGEDGTDIGKKKLVALKENCNYMRAELVRMGLHVYGNYDSPVIPVMLYNPAKIAAFSRELLKRGLAMVVVGFPATSVVLSRSRVCISAGHSREDLDYALKQIAEVADLVKLRYSISAFG
mmetsp:Transcript_1071/g.1513  ORF Transcript_1071/g.1513 Transcript_1071/m.1513 type:complete len:531 (-) Transcript_1071:399-1991(-)